MDKHDTDAYVRAALALQGYAFDETAIARIVAQFGRIESIAMELVDVELPRDAESAETFRP